MRHLSENLDIKQLNKIKSQCISQAKLDLLLLRLSAVYFVGQDMGSNLAALINYILIKFSKK